MNKAPVAWTVRGIGREHNLTCFVCGATDTYLHNIAAFAASEGTARWLVSCFDQGARADIRPTEPNWIQVKVGACDKHLPALDDLSRQWFISEYHINVMVQAALAADRWLASAVPAGRCRKCANPKCYGGSICS